MGVSSGLESSTSAWASVFNLGNCAIGAGILSFPYAVQRCGVHPAPPCRASTALPCMTRHVIHSLRMSGALCKADATLHHGCAACCAGRCESTTLRTCRAHRRSSGMPACGMRRAVHPIRAGAPGHQAPCDHIPRPGVPRSPATALNALLPLRVLPHFGSAPHAA